MNKYLTGIIAILTLTTISSIDSAAKNKQTPKIYMFGIAASFNDSTVYFTDIQELENVWINDKGNFLINRSEYSYQLKNYLEAQGYSHRTCIVSFAFKRKDIEKKFHKTRNKYVKRGNNDLKYINNNEFKFSPVSFEE